MTDERIMPDGRNGTRGNDLERLLVQPPRETGFWRA